MDEFVFLMLVLVALYLLLLAVPRWLMPRVGWIGVGAYGVVVLPPMFYLYLLATVTR